MHVIDVSIWPYPTTARVLLPTQAKLTDKKVIFRGLKIFRDKFNLDVILELKICFKIFRDKFNLDVILELKICFWNLSG